MKSDKNKKKDIKDIIKEVCIYDCKTPNEFLRNCYDNLHKYGFTHKNISHHLGYHNNRARFNDICNMKTIPNRISERIIKGFGLEERRAEFFRTLVAYNNVEKEKDTLFLKLLKGGIHFAGLIYFS